MEEDYSLILDAAEINTLQQILKAFLAHTADKDGNGFYIRKKNIWINKPDFIKKHRHLKGTKGLLQKGVLQFVEVWGYQLAIKDEFIEQVYTLLDTREWELILQMSGVWLEVKK